MNDCSLEELLSKYNIDPEFQKSIGVSYRSPLEDFIANVFGEKPHIRYGGSVAKYTANSNSSDIDLLCYFRSSYPLSVENIFNKMLLELKRHNYICEQKNSAISVKGKYGEDIWDVEIDIVPGKYIDNDEKDVNIWQSRTGNRIKTNPAKQIEIVKKSSMKSVIRLIKLYKTAKGFKFKSFFLEMFCVQIIEPLIREEATLLDKLIAFCSHFNDIGVKKVIDPANTNNDLMSIYSKQDFNQIQQSIKELYEILLTNNERAIIDKIEKNAYCNTSDIYKRDAKSHSPKLNCDVLIAPIQLTCYYNDSNGRQINSGDILCKDRSLYFKAMLYEVSQNISVNLIVSNAGYEARNCKRGDLYEMKKINNYYYYRYETTKYNGDHFVQAIVTINGKLYYSQVFVVRIRDY